MVKVRVPGTTANLGPGFDVLGLAIDRFDDYFFNESVKNFTYHLIGADAVEYQISSGPNNLIYRAFCRLYQEIGQKPPRVEVTCHSSVPICRGLGSSAAAVVAGLTGANLLAGNPLDLEPLLLLATELEGHPDNVAPALFGGLVLSLKTDAGKILYHRYQLDDPELVCVLVVPKFTLETKEARKVLPFQIPYQDAIYNLSRATLLVSALVSREYAQLRELMEDRLHQPYRQQLIPGFVQVKEAGLAAGAYGVAISGAGPTLLALTHTSNADQVGHAMVQAFSQAQITAEWFTSRVYNQGLLERPGDL